MPLFSTAIYACGWYFFVFQERGVGFEIVVEQQNMQKRSNIFCLLNMQNMKTHTM